MNPISTAEARSLLVAAMGRPMSRATFNEKIIPLLVSVGSACKPGREWVIDGDKFGVWLVYAGTRQDRINAGVWSRSRPWSVSDMESIAMQEEGGDQ